MSNEKTGALQLAYCLSIHSYQGSEAPCVIVLLHKSHWHACCQLLYTGVTRARKTLILLGDRWGIRQAAKDKRAAERRTLLSYWATHTG
ncbi:MAG: ATP-binding domain-containing protein [Bacteroidetes bacterium]|nr:ATP-binding domain-containing protein [Bacteroidota bacterium]